MEYKCEKCGEIHEGWPAIAFKTPDSYDALSGADRQKYVKEINDDFCVIEYEDQTDRFIRCVLYQTVIDNCEDLHYGIWVSLSEKSFDDYNAHFSSSDYESTYFGYLSSQIPEYEYMESIRTDVVYTGKNRPEVIPQSGQMDNPFVRDYYEGITKAEAERRIKSMLGE